MISPTARDDSLLITVGNPEQLNTYSLVLCAAGITHRVQYSDSGRFDILVPPHALEFARHELAAYELDNEHFAAPPENSDFAPSFRAMSVCVVAALVFVYMLSGNWQQQSAWFSKGAGDAMAILADNQLYRLLTSLTLHADLVHLLGNCFIGGFLLHFYFFLTGNGLGLLILLFTAVSASYINCLVNPYDHLFVGFSTAIFSVIGILCTSSFVGRPGKPLFHFFMPLMAGLSLLALLGSEGVHTDLGAHLFGLLCGLIVGYAVRLPLFLTLRDSFPIQIIMGACSILLVVLSWFIAFS
jgi:rhomboid protease GluP